MAQTRARRESNLNTLVSTEDLAAHPEWRVFDCRHDLANPALGEQQYLEGHIPGALFAHLDRDLSSPKTGANGRHPLPEPKTFVNWAGKQGLQPSDQVVCYDGGPGASASRLWWMLRWIGHENVAVLDGGFAKWQREGRAVTVDVQTVSATSYPGRAKTSMVAYLSHVEKKLKKAALLDARAPIRYRGEQEPIDPVAGRIPGAKNRFNTDNISPEGIFKAPEVLRAEFEAVLAGRNPGDVINYCGSGVAACHNALAMEIAGLTGSRVYPGSWSEWSTDPTRPISRSV
ncbi:MAG: sulfurtransferase [Candidatus Parcubacteria bacterium]|nr:sulfurtransferase [Burkholderiales bacterium]